MPRGVRVGKVGLQVPIGVEGAVASLDGAEPDFVVESSFDGERWGSVPSKVSSWVPLKPISAGRNEKLAKQPDID